jgi:putative inorganic carbon (HCO3(-)) transporter
VRLLFLIACLGALLPLAALYPHAGVLIWGWFTLMQPHREVFDLPAWLQLNLIIAAVTIPAWLLSREPKLPKRKGLLVLLLLFCVWMALSQLHSLRPDHSWPYFDEALRVMIFVFLSLAVIDRRTRIHAMVWIIVIAIGYHAALAGAFTIVTGGEHLALGPPMSVIRDNNHLGLAIAAFIPLCNYLRLQSRVWLVRQALIALMALSAFAIVGTHSRGAFLSAIVMTLLLLAQSRRRISVFIAVGVLAGMSMTFMPESWDRRMESILGFRSEASYQGREDAWAINWEVAKAHPWVGVGMRVTYLQDAVDPLLSHPRTARAAHSAYFEILGSMGFIALGIYLAIIISTLLDIRRLKRDCWNDPAVAWARDLASMTQVALVTFLFGAAALSMQFWEGFWLMVVLVHRARSAIERELTPSPSALTPSPSALGRRSPLADAQGDRS